MQAPYSPATAPRLQAPADVIIVGSGAGGGVAAMVLADAGLNVLVLEKGPWYTSAQFSNDELKFGQRQFFVQDPHVEPRTFRNTEHDGEHLFVGQVLGLSQCVGGGTVHYGAVSLRFQDSDFRARSFYGPIAGGDLEDWPIGYADLAPYFDRVEFLLGVAGDDTNGGRSHRYRAAHGYPLPPHAANYGAGLFEAAAYKLGLNPYPTPVAITSRPYPVDPLARPGDPLHGLLRPACSYCSFCSSYGCPIDAKGSTLVSTLQRALATGRCEVRPLATVTQVEATHPAAVHYLDADGTSHVATAPVVVLACSAVDTARLALQSRLPDPNQLIGRFLTAHHYVGGIGVFVDRINYWKGFWSMRCLDDYYTGDTPAGQRFFGGGNIQTVGPSAGYPLGASGTIGAAQFLGWGESHGFLMSQYLGHTQWLGLIGHDVPVASNRVDLDPTVRDAHGLPAARITYLHHPNDVAVATYYTRVFDALFQAMGASEWHPAPETLPSAVTSVPQPGPQGTTQRGPARSFPDTRGGLQVHQHGTMRMGADPATSVTNQFGQMWAAPNVFVMDGSLFTTAGGSNPTLTIQALAWRCAEALAGGAARAARGQLIRR